MIPPISIHLPLCNVTPPLLLSRSEVHFSIPWIRTWSYNVLWSMRQRHINRGLNTTFGLGLDLMLQKVFLLVHKETWTSLMEDEFPLDTDGLSQLKPHKPTSLQMTQRLTAATLVTAIETSRRTTRLNSSWWLPQITGTQNHKQIKWCFVLWH